MMPVDEGKISFGLHPNTCAAAAHVARAAANPGSPAAQLALPALITATRTLPPVARRFSLSIVSGAACTRLAVKAAAALAGSSATIKARSVRPLCFSPALAAPKRKPFGIRIWLASLKDIGSLRSKVSARFARGGNSTNLAGEWRPDGGGRKRRSAIPRSARGECGARRPRCVARCEPVDSRRRTCSYPGAERMRQDHADHGHDLPGLPD